MILWLYVFLQFVLSTVLILSTQWRPLPWIALLAGAPGIVLSVSAWLKIGLRKIRVHPTATKETNLVTSGPYGVVRHPMYVGLLWFTAALLLNEFTWWRLISWLALVLVLRLKASYEERSMKTHFPEYVGYQDQVGLFLPCITRVLRSRWFD